MHRDLPLTSCPPPAIPPLFLSSPLPVQRRMAGPLTLFSLIVPFVISLFAFTLERYPSSSPPLPFFPSLAFHLHHPFSSFLAPLFSSPPLAFSFPFLSSFFLTLPFHSSLSSLPLCRASISPSSLPSFSFASLPSLPSLSSPAFHSLLFPSILCCHRATSSLYAPLPFPLLLSLTFNASSPNIYPSPPPLPFPLVHHSSCS